MQSGEVKTDVVASREPLGKTDVEDGISGQKVNLGLLAELADALDSKSNDRRRWSTTTSRARRPKSC
jgi:hypothetical protein